MSLKNRESGRLQAQASGRVLDEASRRRRLRKQLDALEQDNFHEDPHANLQWNKKLPKFEGASPPDASSSNQPPQTKRKKRIKTEIFKQRFRKTLQVMLEEERMTRAEEPNYFSAVAPPSKQPPRKFCAVCGCFSAYTCIKCGARYCSLKCRSVHEDTRCLKWTV